jgi:DNA-binding NtrC family response regulator
MIVTKGRGGLAESLPPPRVSSQDFEVAVRSRCNVLITADAGCDRLACARAIHENDGRGNASFVAVRSDGSPLLEEAARGANVDDWFQEAAGGTLFIDDVGLMSRRAQVRLWLCLTRQAVGGAASTMDRVRVIAGTDHSLRAAAAAGSFSEALFYRLNAIHLQQPD